MERNEKFVKIQRYAAILLVALFFFFFGNYVGKSGYIFELRKNPPKVEFLNKAPKSEKIDFELFWKVWDLVASKYLLRPVDPQEMMYGAIKGMVNALGDPYTSFLPPVVNKTVSNALNGTYEGIGAELGIKDEQLIIVSPLDGSPAKDAGLKAGDKITAIDGENTVGITLTEAVSKIRGNAGTMVELKIQRGIEQPFAIKIRRGAIVVKSIKWEDKGDGVIYIRLSRFGSDTNGDWDKMVSEINVKTKELNVVVLDLRGNPGGYLQSAVHLAGEFFRNKVVVYQENSLGKTTPFETSRVGVFDGIPVIVIIDEGSASASEILAAALKVNSGATLVGTKSFGKGTIQDTSDFSDGSGIHITVAKWLTPEKKWIHGTGIEPDVKVEIDPKDAPDVDKQLDKALELARKK